MKGFWLHENPQLDIRQSGPYRVGVSRRGASEYPAGLLSFFADVERAWVALGGMPHVGKMFGFYDPTQPAGRASGVGIGGHYCCFSEDPKARTAGYFMIRFGVLNLAG